MYNPIIFWSLQWKTPNEHFCTIIILLLHCNRVCLLGLDLVKLDERSYSQSPRPVLHISLFKAHLQGVGRRCGDDDMDGSSHTNQWCAWSEGNCSCFSSWTQDMVMFHAYVPDHLSEVTPEPRAGEWWQEFSSFFSHSSYLLFLFSIVSLENGSTLAWYHQQH